MSLSKIFKAAAEQTGESFVKKGTTEALKRKVQEEFGTGLSSVTQETLKNEAKLGVDKVSLEQARESGKEIYKYEAQALAEEENYLRGVYRDATEMALNKTQNGEVTPKQALDMAYQIQEMQTQKSLKRVVAGTAPAQTMKMASESEIAKAMNIFIPKFGELVAQQPPAVVLKTMNDIANGNTSFLKELNTIGRQAQKDGLGYKIYVNAQNFVKNAMLAQNPIGRFADAGGNLVNRGITTIDLYIAEQTTKAGQKLSSKLPEGILRGVLSGDGVYAGETATMLNGMRLAAVDYVKTGSQNVVNFIKNNKNGIRETVIGRNARKIDYQFTWDRENLVENAFVPMDMMSVLKSSIKNIPNTVSNIYMAPGYGLTKQLDNITAGSFRAGDLALKARHYAIQKSREIGQGENEKLISDLEKYFIERDQGNDVDGLATSIQDYFGRNVVEDISDQISREVTDSAARDVFRLKPETLIGKYANLIDKGIRSIPIVKNIYDWTFPFARVPIRILDRVAQDFPLRNLSNIFTEYNKAAKNLRETGKVNSTEFYRAVGKFGQGVITWSVLGSLVSSGYITGNRPKDKQVSKMWETKGIKENAFNIPDENGNIAYSIPFIKAGAPAETLSLMVNCYNELKDIYDNYQNPAKPYGIPSMMLHFVELLVSTPLWNTVFGQFAREIDAGSFIENHGASLLKIFPRLKDNIEKVFGEKDGEIANKVLLNYGKQLKEYKLEMVPRLNFFGEYIKDGIKTNQNELLTDVANLGVKVTEPELTTTAKVDGIEMTLNPEQKYLWQRLMSGFEIKDSKYDVFGRKTDLYTELYSAMKSDEYLLSGTSEYIRDVTGDIIKNDKTRQAIVSKVYNDSKKAAFEYFISFKDRQATNDFEKKLKRNAIDLWNRAQEVKQMKLDKPLKPTVPTLR